MILRILLGSCDSTNIATMYILLRLVPEAGDISESSSKFVSFEILYIGLSSSLNLGCLSSSSFHRLKTLTLVLGWS